LLLLSQPLSEEEKWIGAPAWCALKLTVALHAAKIRWERAHPANQSIHYVDIMEQYAEPLRPIGAHTVHHGAVVERYLPASPVSPDSRRSQRPSAIQ